jgi:anaerobic selenocysteine-containing dehydrogenase
VVATLTHSICALDCPDCCGLLVHVDQRGHATRLQGDPAHPVTRGFLCGKVAQYLEREYHPDRLMQPLRRSGPKGSGQFTEIGWDEALDEIAARLRSIAGEFGPEAILPYSYAGTMGLLNGAGMDRRFFHRLGASRLDRTICSTAGGAGMMASLGCRLGTEPEQFAHSKLIIAWGANIHGTNVHLWPFIVEARRRGARLYTIDPITTRTATLADRHYPILPGSDMALALGMLHVIFAEGLEDKDYLACYTTGEDSLRRRTAEYPPERAAALTGIGAEEIARLAREYATTQPAAIRLNYGVQRSERGGRAVQAITLLPAVTGQWRHVGGGLQLSTSGAFAFNYEALQMPGLQQAALGREARLVNMVELGAALDTLDSPPVKALVVYNSNPAAIAPNQNRVHAGLSRPDLYTVVLEQMRTDTAMFADIVLPVTTFLEHTDLYFAYGHYYLQMARPALAAPGECRSNVEIFRALAKRMGFTEPCFDETPDQMIRAALDSPSPYFAGIRFEDLAREGRLRLNVSPPGTPFLPFAEGGFGAAGKCNLDATALDYAPPVESRLGAAGDPGRYPLELVSSKNDDSMNSTFGHRDAVDAETARLWIHPADAAPRGIRDGDRVAVYNDRGRCWLAAEVTARVRPGVVRAPAVRWPSRAPGRAGINVLTSDRLTDIGGGPVFYNCLVEVLKCES